MGCFGGLSTVASQKSRVSREEELEGELSDQRFADLVASARPHGIRRPTLPRKVLEQLQRAIGSLQPGELNSRDLQYSNPNQNRQACSRALRHLFLAVGMEPPM